MVTSIITGCKRKTFDEYLAEEAEKFTSTQCPRQIDKLSRIDSMVYDQTSRVLNYYYTLQYEEGKKETLSQTLIEDFREALLVNLRDDISLKKHKENEISFCYHYFMDNKKEETFQLLFTPKDYNGKLNLHTFNYRETRNLREFSKTNCPIRQDKCTVLDSIWYDSISRTYYYDYSLEGELDNDSIFGPSIKRALKKSLVQGLSKDEELANERDKEKLDFGYRYFSSSTKALLLEMIIKNSEIKKEP